MNVLSISTSDQSGGAEGVALDLHRKYLAAGHDARLVVKWKRTNHPGIFPLARFPKHSLWSRLLDRMALSASRRDYFRGQFAVQDWLADLAAPMRLWGKVCGADNYPNPRCQELLRWTDGWQPDVIHAHNLHGRYFDLSALPALCQGSPVVVTLHDTWLMTGHCGYFVDCNRWQIGCGECPDLKRYPAIARDRTRKNAAEKRSWLQACERLHLITPSEWLRNLVSEARLPCASLRCLHNGVDLTTFNPLQESKDELRRRQGLPEGHFIVLGVAASLTSANVYKDVQTLAAVCEKLSSNPHPRIHCVLLGGGDAVRSRPGFSFPGYIRDPRVVADYYRAADVFLHTANADNFPCTVLEAQACGTPVVATAVGGVPEQIVDGQTGMLTERGDVAQMVNRVLELAARPDLLDWGRRAAQHARANFDLENQAGRYLTVLASLLN
ncbi:MAG: glycosyltransferase [Verrucomicrobia bacterium]|nr:glycosyltransferase [Verrucomicrobiota bacterium]